MALCVTNEKVGPVPARLTADWRLLTESHELALYAICTNVQGDLFYIFCPIDHGSSVLDKVPVIMRELIIFSPMVPIRRTQAGFQMMSICEWEDLMAEEATAMPMFSAAALSVLPEMEDVVSNDSFESESEISEEEEIVDIDEVDDDDEEDEECTVTV
jgi:hypothetical protein